MIKYLFILQCCTICTTAAAVDMEINLNCPTVEKGSLSTTSGGVITLENLRIQAKNISYIKNPPKICAEGNLLIRFKETIFHGEKVEYYPKTKTGYITNGVAKIDIWFFGGEQITLNPDNSFSVKNAFITTSENKNYDWQIACNNLNLNDKGLLNAEKTALKIGSFPIFYLPKFKSNLKSFSDSPLTYRVEWGTGLWPKFGIRYKLYSWERSAVFASANLRPTQGVGGAIETDFKSKNTELRTKSYLDHDPFYRDNQPNKARTHCRLQGLFKFETSDAKTHIDGIYDYLSDRNLQADFHYEDFVLDDSKKTRLTLRRNTHYGIAGMDGHFRINRFQGMKQELPTLFFHPRPIELGSTGIMSDNKVSISYLDYVSAKDIEPDIPDFGSFKASTSNSLYKPFHLKGLIFKPEIGFDGLYYSNSRKDKSIVIGNLKSMANLDLPLICSAEKITHILTPYLCYKGITRPNVTPDTPYIFSIKDGFNRLNEVKIGLKNLLFIGQSNFFHPNITFDVHLYSFLDKNPLTKVFPKLRSSLLYATKNYEASAYLDWNFQNKVLNQANLCMGWTISQNFAFKTEFRHRSNYSWRKSNPDNFIMEMTRTPEALLETPLSDGRNTLLTRLQLNIAPLWTARLQSQIGWGRKAEPNYNEAKVDISTIISTSWIAKLTYVHSLAPLGKNDRVYFELSLLDKKKALPK